MGKIKKKALLITTDTQVKMFLDEFDDVPWEALRYTAGETNYGGRVTDSHDRTAVNAMLKLLYRLSRASASALTRKRGRWWESKNSPDTPIHRYFLRDIAQIPADVV